MKLILTLLALLLSVSPTYAGLWETNCSSCHNGKVAPSKESLRKKFKTADEFIDAVRSKVLEGKMPRGLGYRFVAKELYGKFPQCKCRCRKFRNQHRLANHQKVISENYFQL